MLAGASGNFAKIVTIKYQLYEHQLFEYVTVLQLYNVILDNVTHDIIHTKCYRTKQNCCDQSVSTYFAYRIAGCVSFYISLR